MPYPVTFDEPKIEPIDGSKWLLKDNWTVTYRGDTYIVESGFITDGASIPFFLRWLCGDPMQKPRVYAAIIHDWFYAGRIPHAYRPEADDLYRDMMISLGVPRWKAYLEWKALRLFGFASWKGWKAILASAALPAICACATKTRNVELDGMYLSEAGTLAIGSVDVMASPVGEETATVKYNEDTAWLSPSTKLHEIKIMLTGTNSVGEVKHIVRDICKAFSAASTNQTQEVQP